MPRNLHLLSPSDLHKSYGFALGKQPLLRLFPTLVSESDNLFPHLHWYFPLFHWCAPEQSPDAPRMEYEFPEWFLPLFFRSHDRSLYHPMDNYFPPLHPSCQNVPLSLPEYENTHHPLSRSTDIFPETSEDEPHSEGNMHRYTSPDVPAVHAYVHIIFHSLPVLFPADLHRKISFHQVAFHW